MLPMKTAQLNQNPFALVTLPCFGKLWSELQIPRKLFCLLFTLPHFLSFPHSLFSLSPFHKNTRTDLNLELL